jgi:hypothetical protein
MYHVVEGIATVFSGHQTSCGTTNIEEYADTAFISNHSRCGSVFEVCYHVSSGPFDCFTNIERDPLARYICFASIDSLISVALTQFPTSMLVFPNYKIIRKSIAGRTTVL